MRIAYKNLSFRWIGAINGPRPTVAVLVSHGWYHTGWRMFGGTRNTVIPAGLTIRWYCHQGASSKMSISAGLAGANEAWALSQYAFANIGPESVTDYFLSHKEGFSPDPTCPGKIIITVIPPKMTTARLSDIIMAREVCGLNFNTLHFTACREAFGALDEVDFD
jgi:hypothetical protein